MDANRIDWKQAPKRAREQGGAVRVSPGFSNFLPIYLARMLVGRAI